MKSKPVAVWLGIAVTLGIGTLVTVFIRLINRSEENYPLNMTRMMSSNGDLYIGKAIGEAATAMANSATTAQQQSTVSVDDADKLREVFRLGLMLCVNNGEQTAKTITAVLQRDAGIREEN
jgi:hypothetical protein